MLLDIPAFINLTLGIIAIGISVIAIYISMQSDNKMTAISDYLFTEKLAILYAHIDKIPLESPPPHLMRRIREDLSAAKYLIKYMSKDKKEELIYVTKIIIDTIQGPLDYYTEEEILDIKNIIQDIRRTIKGKSWTDLSESPS